MYTIYMDVTKFNNYILYTDMFGAFYLNNILCEGEEKNIIILVICDHNTVYLKLWFWI